MAGVASHSYGTNSTWSCDSDSDFQLMFNSLFPLPSQNTWSVFRPNTGLCMKVISLLRMKASTLEEWRRIPKIGQYTGEIGAPTCNLWKWTRTCNTRITQNEHDFSWDSKPDAKRDIMENSDRSNLQQSLLRSRPLARRSLWNVRETH
jgi:hypothetical protein